MWQAFSITVTDYSTTDHWPVCYVSDLNTDYYSNIQKVEFAENVTEATQTIHLSEERIHV